MDVRFSSDLQTTLHLIGRSEGDKKFAAPKSQDPLDRVLHEFFVADTASALFKKRREDAKDMLLAQVSPDTVQRVISEAIKQNSVQRTVLATTEHYSASFSAAKPVERLDKVALRNEFIKLGVDEVTIEKAFSAATLTNEPAKTLIVSTTHVRSEGGR